MFYIKEPSLVASPWLLSGYKDNKVVAIPVDVTRDLKNYHILGIDFLFKNLSKQFKGAILNEDEGMNMHVQVAVFMRTMFYCTEQKFLVLIIAPDNLIIKWHYHLNKQGGLKVQVVTPNTRPEDFDEEHGLALLLSFSNIRLAEYLVDYDYSSVVIDNFDETNPDQKLQWTMLNWSNPGCVGKLSDFYEIDNDNFANLRDNYRHWWLRLTWKFCESFSKISEAEINEYEKILLKWATSHSFTRLTTSKTFQRKKCKQYEIIEDTIVKNSIGDLEIKRSNSVEETVNEQNNESNINITESETFQKKGKKRKHYEIIDDKIVKNSMGDPEIKQSNSVEETVNEQNNETNINITESENWNEGSQNSDSTIIYELLVDEEIIGEEQRSASTVAYDVQKNKRDPTYVELPSMDENPILNSIIKNFEKSPEPIEAHHFTCTALKYDINQPNCSKVYEENDVLMSIINDTNTSASQELDDQTQFSYKREKIYSQIFSDAPCTSRSMQMDDDADIIESLISSDCDIKLKRDAKSEIKKIKISNIEDILQETDLLLTE